MPEVGIVHDFLDDSEIDYVKNISKGELFTTPYNVDGKQKFASNLRMSKIKYINEMRDQTARKISDRIEYLTKFTLRKTFFDSENYQVMNYGIGGRISPHTDSTDENLETTTESVRFGGPRIMTFMVYLSNIYSGGNTVFPNLGLAVEPIKGSALFWFNFSANMKFGETVKHMGCPIIYGNKWIVNKWIKFLAQFQHYKCASDADFSIFDQHEK